MSALATALEGALRAPVEARDGLVDRALEALRIAPADALPVDATARRALWLNTYNVLTLHSVRGRGASMIAAWHRCAFPRHAIAGQTLTLDELEHGLLRANARAPYRVTRPFGDRDPRRGWMVPLDPRIHFALNCGAVSCPPVRVYDEGRLDAQLAIAEASFLSSETRIDDRARAITTSRLLDFYTSDFGDVDAVIGRIERACDRPARSLAGYRLTYARYDWTAKIRFAAEETPLG